jgi:hypothetical protein
VAQIVGDHPEADPGVHAAEAMTTTAARTMSTFDHTDAAFRADPPALTYGFNAFTFACTATHCAITGFACARAAVAAATCTAVGATSAVCIAIDAG